ncbi:MAG TPA: PxKF domain-containing protein [Thermohalobaculum sp.]|nr:PxKF domain-containing protein [Thermohalobaculum sp.]
MDELLVRSARNTTGGMAMKLDRSFGSDANGAFQARTERVTKRLSGAGAVLGALAIWFGLSGQALAAADELYPNSATWAVNTIADGNITNGFNTPGANGATTLNTDVFDGDAILVTAGWRIRDNSAAAGVDTNYGASGRTVIFTAVTSSKPLDAADVVVSAIANCTVTSAASTCSTAISFTAPATVGTYQIQINTNGGPGPGPLTTRQLRINFTVAEDVAAPIDTKLTVYQQCYLLNQGDVDLTAKLEELVSGSPIDNAEIDFFIDPPSPSIGSAFTEADGVATLTHDITGLGVGDYNLYAEFAGDNVYNGSNDSATLGITYLFAGFGEPINGDGSSIFGGRIIPIKIRLFDANGVPVTDATPTVWLKDVDNVMGLGTDLVATTSVSAADTGNIMRYVPDDQQYIYNWDARDLLNGTYYVVVDLGDSPTCRPEDPSAIITVQKKGKK